MVAEVPVVTPSAEIHAMSPLANEAAETSTNGWGSDLVQSTREAERTAVDGADSGPCPALFRAVTTKEYATQLTRPVTSHEVAGAVAVHDPDGDPETVYAMVESPPSSVGGVHDTVAVVGPLTAETAVGAPGTLVVASCGVTELEGADGGPSPMLFVAVTVKV